MNIIEKEIAEREAEIAAKEEKLRLAEDYLLKATALKEEADAIDVDTLNRDIEELKGYLPAPVEPVAENVATPEVTA